MALAICLASGKLSDGKQKFSWCHPFKSCSFCRLQTCEFLSIWRLGFLIFLFCKPQQRYFDLNLENKYQKNLSLISFT